MWRAVNQDGSLTYSFVEKSWKLPTLFIPCVFFGGLLFLIGMLVMSYNVWRTIAGAKAIEVPVPSPA